MNRAEILDAAKQAVTVDRAATHGKAEDTFGMIAALWSVRLGVDIRPDQVAIMMMDLKTARAWGNPGHADNWMDMAGYAACGGELAHVPDGVIVDDPLNAVWRRTDSLPRIRDRAKFLGAKTCRSCGRTPFVINGASFPLFHCECTTKTCDLEAWNAKQMSPGVVNARTGGGGTK